MNLTVFQSDGAIHFLEERYNLSKPVVQLILKFASKPEQPGLNSEVMIEQTYHMCADLFYITVIRD